MASGVGFSGMSGWTPSTASQCGTTLTAMGGRGSFAARISLRSISLFDRYVQLGVAGHFLERDGPGARGEAVQGLAPSHDERRVDVLGAELGRACSVA